jgi:ELWxxDGT repeat protein
LIKDINPVGDSSPIGLTVFNNKFVFAATEPIHGRELWISDGTLSGTYIIKDQNPGAGNSTMGIPFVYKNKLYMSLIVDPLNGNQFGVSNGTNSGTAQIMIGTAGASYPSNPQYFASLNGMVYFVADKGLGDGLQIFRTDGTFSGTVQLTAGLLNNNPLNKPKELIEYKGRIYFKGTDFAVTKTEVYVLYYK